MHKKLRFYFYLSIWCFALIELWSFVMINTDVIKTLTVPSYARENINSKFWVDSNEVFGAWHGLNSTYIHKTRCFEATYKANSYGARDKERSIESTSSRVIVLGDSLIEGFGVKTGRRISDLLESSTGVEHLNFGNAGFGTTQYVLLYETLARKFSHDSVILGLSPATDFHDDNIEYGKAVFSNRYRPYYVGSYPSYQISYYKKSLDTEQGSSFVNTLKGVLREFSYSYNILSHYRAKINFEGYGQNTENIYSGYYDFSEGEFLKAKYSIENLVRLAKEKNVKLYLCSIPKLTDFSIYKEKGAPPLNKKLFALSEELGFQYVDLLTLLDNVSDNPDKYFFSCDGHLNEYGNEMVSNILLSKFKLYKPL